MTLLMRNLLKKDFVRGGRKCKAPEVREAMFEWFINVQGVLKGHLPFDFEWLKQQPEPVSEQDQLKFSKHWIQD